MRMYRGRYRILVLRNQLCYIAKNRLVHEFAALQILIVTAWIADRERLVKQLLDARDILRNHRPVVQGEFFFCREHFSKE